MDVHESASRVVRFGVFELDRRAGELRKAGQRVRLQDQPLRVLEALLTAPGEPVTRDELRKRLWADDTFVDFDNGLNRAINRLRRALGDTAESPRFIETLERRGYRFIAPVSPATVPAPSGGEATAAAPLGRTPRRRTGALLVAALAVAAALAALYVAQRRPRPGAPPRTLAVLPLANLTGDPSQEYFSDGMTDAVITRLASVPSLHVISRQSVMGYKSSPRPMREIARELGVEVVVEGSVVRSDDRVRVTAQLIHAPTDRHLWAQSYDRPLADVLALQQEIADAVAAQVAQRLASPASPAPKTRPVDPRAYELFLRGRFHLHELNPASLRQAAEYFDRARAVDPTFAPAFAGLATSTLLQEFWGEGSRSPARIEEVRRSLARALELDPNLADAHDTLGRVLLHYDFDWAGAAAAFHRAVELEPSSMSAHNGKSLLHQSLLQWDEALAAAARAVALDPLSPMALAEEGRVFYRMRRYAEAEQRFRRALALNPGFGSALDRLIQLLLTQGRLREAREALGRLEELPSHRQPRSLNLRARLEAKSGNLPAARALLAEIHEASLGRVSVVVALRDHDRAFRELEALVAAKTMSPYGWSNPDLDPLRGDPRFAALVARMGLPVDLLVAHGRPPGP